MNYNQMIEFLKSKHKIIIFLIVIFFLIIGSFFMFFTNVSPEEGFYLRASQNVYNGKILYKDFVYTQAPVLPYIYGIPLLILGSSLIVGRITSLIFLFLTLLLIIKISNHLGGKIASIFASLFFVLNFSFIGFTSTIQNSSTLCFFFMVLSVFFLISKLKNYQKIILSVFFMGLAVGTRLLAAPALFILLVFILINYEKKEFILSLISSILILELIFLPFLIIAPKQTWFGLLGYNQTRSVITAGEWFVEGSLQQILGSLINKISVLMNTISSYFIYFIIFIVSLFLFISKKDKKIKTILKSPLIVLIFSIIFIGIANFIPKPTWVNYIVLIVPFMAILAGVCSKFLIENSKNKKIIVLFIFVGLILTPISNTTPYLSIYYPSSINDISEVSKFIEEKTSPEDKVLTFETPLIIASKRDLLPGLDMGRYGYYPKLTNEEVEKLNAINTPILIDYIENKKPKLVILTSHITLNYLRGIPQTLELINRSLQKNYNLIETKKDFAVYWGDLFIYESKK